MWKWILIYTACLGTLAGVTDRAVAAGIETLVMPGKLIDGHAQYEEACSNCHTPFNKESQNRLCLDCHEEVAADISNKEGFHGRGRVREAGCSHCHTDHKGRDADIIHLGKETFNHDNTDYFLAGAHVGTVCGACHAGGKKYREAPALCIDCHRGEDIHRGELGRECAGCHEERSWKRPEFDHGDTDFALHGRHADLGCNSCHAGERYSGLPKKCSGCHQLDDVHAGRYGSGCESCHSEDKWTRIDFDHDTGTNYPLAGSHRKVQCDACHAGGTLNEKTGSACVDCHHDDDEHQGRYGRECGACHMTGRWGEVAFDHDAKTEFPLRGKHGEAACTSCHRGDAYKEDLAMDCYSCHGPDDVHQGQQGRQCEHCHAEQGWDSSIRFNHDMASFPLIGLHAVVPCEECHLSATFREAGHECSDCHQADDVHKQQLGSECESCHNPNAWTLWEFDHNTRSGFQLEGEHAGLDCLACHTHPVRKDISLSMSCGGCHRDDDVHEGRFGSACERCHNDESFAAVEFR